VLVNARVAWAGSGAVLARRLVVKVFGFVGGCGAFAL